MKLVQALVGLTIVAWLVCESQEYGVNMGPYDIVLEQIFACEDQGNGKGNFQLSLYLGPPDANRKRKRLHRGSFSWPFTKEETEAMDLDVDFYQKKNSDYLLMYPYKDNMCKTLDDVDNGAFSSLQKACGIPVERCSIPYGNYSYDDWEVIFELAPPMLEYGPYKAIIRVLADKEVFGCATVLGDVKPKPGKLAAWG